MKVGLTFCSVKSMEFEKIIAICHAFDFKYLKCNLWAISRFDQLKDTCLMGYTVTLRPVKPGSLSKGLLWSVLLAGLCACTNAQPRHADMAPAVASQTFEALRSTAGHFAGGAWNDDVDRWNGKKHRAMETLLEQVRQGDYQSSQLIELMGQPDRIWPESAEHYSRVLQQTQWQGAAHGELWAYHWRGEHDQLLFALQKGRVTASGWLFSGE